MILQDFRSLVWNIAKTEGTPYLKLSDTGQLNDLCQEQLNVYASRTQCLQSDRVAFFPIVGQSSYDTSALTQTINGVAVAVFAKPLCFVRQVYINGVPLQICRDVSAIEDPPVRYGESSEYTVSQAIPGYVAATNNRPIYWWQEPPNVLRFNCPFDQVYSNCFVSGRLYHAPLTIDSQVLDLPAEDIRPAARLAASELLMVYSKDAGLAMRKLVEEEIKQRSSASQRKSSGHARRGSGEARRSVNLAR